MFLHMAILHISMWYQHNPMKTVPRRVRESMKKRPKTTLLTPIFDLWGEKSKFRRITFLHMAILHIYMRYQHHPMKIVGRVRETMKKRQKTTLFPRYLTFGGKNQNSAALRFCIWPFYTFLCDISTIQWKLLDEFAKVWKNDQKRQVFPPLWPWPWPGDLETYARIFMYPRSIYPASFVKFR